MNHDQEASESNAATVAAASAPPATAKLIAASVGAIVTSLSSALYPLSLRTPLNQIAVTPFDVIKVRLQTQSQHQLRKDRVVTPPQSLPHHAHPIPHQIAPLHKQKRLTGSVDAVIKISRNEGFPALWKGLTPTL